MREIKFRAWVADRKTMVGWKWLLSIAYGANKIIDEDIDDSIFNDPDLTLMQFTGLRDSNGAEVYEGDILYQDGYSNWIVEWCDAGFYIYNSCNPGTYYPFTPAQAITREVIGNIYSNPELVTP